MDWPAGACRLLIFPFLMLLNFPPNMCSTLNSLDQLHKKWILCFIIKHRLYTAHWIVLTPTPLSIWTMEAPSKMTTLISSAKSYTGGPNTSKPVSSFTTDMRHIRHPPTKNVTLSYPHKNNVWYGSFKGRETLEICIYSSLTVLRQSIDWHWDKVCELKHCRIYMSAYLFVCLFVSLSVCLSKR